jgi:hypothetical protein
MGYYISKNTSEGQLSSGFWRSDARLFGLMDVRMISQLSKRSEAL